MELEVFGERLRELRLRTGLSAVKLGKALGVSDVIIGHWEKGERSPSGESLSKIAQFFGVSMDYLAGLKDK
ncbi:MAG: helix-turn-helix domain-containing protein [Firmicutes bacterium]|nr:helix-turn-helix domain-containing protein [Bacillota bacterium]